MKFKLIFATCFLATLGTSCVNKQSTDPSFIEKNDIYFVTGDSVVQGDFVAKAISDTEVVTNYTSPADEAPSPLIEFRLSLNSRDNELIP